VFKCVLTVNMSVLNGLSCVTVFSGIFYAMLLTGSRLVSMLVRACCVTVLTGS
jgi:hypothetical protein